MYESYVKGTRGRGRPIRGWIGSIKNVLHACYLRIQAVRESVHGRFEWRSVI